MRINPCNWASNDTITSVLSADTVLLYAVVRCHKDSPKNVNSLELKWEMGQNSFCVSVDGAYTSPIGFPITGP